MSLSRSIRRTKVKNSVSSKRENRKDNRKAFKASWQRLVIRRLVAAIKYKHPNKNVNSAAEYVKMRLMKQPGHGTKHVLKMDIYVYGG